MRSMTGEDLVALAAALVDEHAGIEAGARSERHHVQRVFLGADIARLMSRVRIADPDLSPALIRARVDELKRLIGLDVRAQLDLSELPGIDEDLHDVEFLDATRAELDQMRQAIRPIARKLAARLARRRAHHTGRVNIRRTMRQLTRQRRRAARPASRPPPRPQAGTVRAVRHQRLGRRLLAVHADVDVGDLGRVGANHARSCSSTPSTR